MMTCKLQRQADGHEEQAEQDAAERLDVGFELVAIGGFGKHHAGEEGAHRHRQAGKLHQRRRPEHDEQCGGDHRLRGAGIGDDPEERGQEIAAGDQQRRRSAPKAMAKAASRIAAVFRTGPSSTGTSASSGTMAMSWNSRIENARLAVAGVGRRRPASRICRAKAVDDSARPKPTMQPRQPAMPAT